MNYPQIKIALEELIKNWSVYPFEFFNILHDPSNHDFTIENENENWDFVKSEEWHNLNLDGFILWATSDNGHLLYWNGQQILMLMPRDFEFHSLASSNLNTFLNCIKTGNNFGLFPDNLNKV